MLAPHNVTSTLRMMSDQQLAQYARMHQNDPYIFPLAFQESQDRKNMRAGQVAKMSGQAQPPVNQQDLAQMEPQQALPEEQGIGALPAQNLEGMGHADGGIIGYKDRGLVDYNRITDEDINPIMNQYQPQTAEELASSRAAIANPMNAEMEAAYKPFTERLTKREAELAGKKDSNIQNAMLSAGLSMMAGTSPHAFSNIGKGGLEGLQTYQAAEKADQASRDALDHSQMLMMQAQRAERSGNNRDATTLLDAANKQKEAHIAHGLTALSLKNTSQFQEGQLANTALQRQIEAGKAAEAARHNKQLEELYYKPLGENKPSQQDKLLNQVMTRVNSDPLIKSLAAQLDPKTGSVQPGTQEYNDLLTRVHNLATPYYTQAGLEAPELPTLDTITPQAPQQGFFDRLWNGPKAAPVTPQPAPVAPSKAPGGGGWSIKPIGQ